MKGWYVLCTYRESWFPHRSFLNFACEGHSHSWAAKTHTASLTLGNTHSLLEVSRLQPYAGHLSSLWWRQAYLRPQNPSCLKNLKVPKKYKIGMNSYFTLVWWKPVCLSKFICHSGLIRPQKKFKNWEFRGNINRPSRNPPASVGLQNQCCTAGNAVTLQLEMLFWKMYWWDEWWWWCQDASKGNLPFLNRKSSARLKAFSVTSNIFYNIFHRNSEL